MTGPPSGGSWIWLLNIIVGEYGCWMGVGWVVVIICHCEPASICGCGNLFWWTVHYFKIWARRVLMRVTLSGDNYQINPFSNSLSIFKFSNSSILKFFLYCVPLNKIASLFKIQKKIAMTIPQKKCRWIFLFNGIIKYKVI